MEQVHARASEQMPNQASLLLKQLSDVDRGPRGLRDLWKNAQQAVPDSVEKAFLEAGFGVWLAYICTKRGAENKEKFLGKAACRDLVASLEKQPSEYLNSLAAAVARGIGPDIETKVKEIEGRIDTNMSQQSNKRQRERVAECFNIILLIPLRHGRI